MSSNVQFTVKWSNFSKVLLLIPVKYDYSWSFIPPSTHLILLKRWNVQCIGYSTCMSLNPFCGAFTLYVPYNQTCTSVWHTVHVHICMASLNNHFPPSCIVDQPKPAPLLFYSNPFPTQRENLWSLGGKGLTGPICSSLFLNSFPPKPTLLVFFYSV